jgi:hypothetical protein
MQRPYRRLHAPGIGPGCRTPSGAGRRTCRPSLRHLHFQRLGSAVWRAGRLGSVGSMQSGEDMVGGQTKKRTVGFDGSLSGLARTHQLRGSSGLTYSQLRCGQHGISPRPPESGLLQQAWLVEQGQTWTCRTSEKRQQSASSTTRGCTHRWLRERLAVRRGTATCGTHGSTQLVSMCTSQNERHLACAGHWRAAGGPGKHSFASRSHLCQRRHHDRRRQRSDGFSRCKQIAW